MRLLFLLPLLLLLLLLLLLFLLLLLLLLLFLLLLFLLLLLLSLLSLFVFTPKYDSILSFTSQGVLKSVAQSWFRPKHWVLQVNTRKSPVSEPSGSITAVVVAFIQKKNSKRTRFSLYNK